MPKYMLEELSIADNWEIETHFSCEEPYKQKQEGLIYLFGQWLELISPNDFGNDEGLAGVLV